MNKSHGLIEGQWVHFLNEKLPYTVMAVSKRYAVCSRKLNKTEDKDLIQYRVEMRSYRTFTEAYNDLKTDPVYTIIDFELNERGPDNLVFGLYDYFSKEDCLKVIIDLMDVEELSLSSRNKITLNIDWNKTKKHQ